VIGDIAPLPAARNRTRATAATPPARRPATRPHQRMGLDELQAGLRPVRLLSAVVLFAATLLAVWAPLLLTGPGWQAVALRVLVGVYLLGVAGNHAVLLWLTRGPAPLEQRPATAAAARLFVVSLIPAALPLLVRRARS